jgi:solute carrier family 35 protein E1
LSPLFTVAAYALLFGVRYSSKTYLSLLPLTLGVMLACSFEVSASNTIGLLCAFGSALVFVSSNIFFKKIMPSNTGGMSQPAHKLDKLNLLLYSSGMAFILMIPIWMYYDLPLLLGDPKHVVHPKEGHSAPHSVSYYFFMNGTVHYAQNIIAFVILSSTSPVTYSIASLIKRVAVICIAIVWFSQAVHPIQAFGIVLTFTGLYMYNNAKGDVAKGEKKVRRIEASRDILLPTTKEDSRVLLGVDTPPEPLMVQPSMGLGSGALDRSRAFSISKQEGNRFYNSSYTHHRPSQASVSSNFTHALDTKLKNVTEGSVSSPVDSYPSPPPSISSPTSETIPLPHHGGLHHHGYRQHVAPVGS